tara:strand:+ start:823 stop:1053 length:231 start_codon:yes stop_codon:yes gene_type:complete
MRTNKPYKPFKMVKVGVEEYFTTEYKPRFIWLDKILNKIYIGLRNIAWLFNDLNIKYNRVEYQQKNYRDVFEKEYV